MVVTKWKSIRRSVFVRRLLFLITVIKEATPSLEPEG